MFNIPQAFLQKVSRHQWVLTLLAFQIIAWLLVWPVGNFPLNDDWAYAHSVQWLWTERRLRLSDWIAMTLLPQTTLGFLAQNLFGQSYHTLRALTFVVSILTAWLMVLYLCRSGFSRAVAMALSLLLCALPWWQALAYSYMTEFYALPLALAGSMLAVTQLEAKRENRQGFDGAYFGMNLLFALGVLQRQTLLVFPLAFAVVSLCSLRPSGAWRLETLSRILHSIFPLVLAWVALWLYQSYLQHGPGIPEAQSATYARLGQNGILLLSGDIVRWQALGSRIAVWIGYTGLSLFALAFVSIRRSDRQRFFVIALVVLLAQWAVGWLPPFNENNVLDANGLGPFTVIDGMRTDERAALPTQAVLWRYALAPFSAIGVSWLLVGLMGMGKTATWKPAQRFALVATVLYAAPLVATDFFDRYVYFILPWTVIAIWQKPPPSLPTRFYAAIAAIAVLSIAAAHDYHAWQRARWTAIEHAVARGGGPDTIDGGFEYNGYTRFNAPERGPAPGKSWWWVKDDLFRISFGPQQGYAEIARIRVKRWLPTTPREVLVSQRLTSKSN